MRRAGSRVERSRALVAAVACAACLVACSEIGPETCDRPEREEPLDYTGGSIEGGVYMSAPWNGELLHFPGGAHYRIHHRLGVVPRWWIAYLSFESHGLAEGSVAPAAGNEAELKAIDAETLTLLNGSCAEYWLLLVAGGG
jgi:hypothetical protein